MLFCVLLYDIKLWYPIIFLNSLTQFLLLYAYKLKIELLLTLEAINTILESSYNNKLIRSKINNINHIYNKYGNMLSNDI